MAKEIVDARKVRFDRPAALRLARSADRVIALRGRSVVTILLKNHPADDELAAALLGPTGNLRAPTIRIGRTLVVGFNASIYAAVLP